MIEIPSRKRLMVFSGSSNEGLAREVANILGTIVMVDIQGTSSYESASGFIDLSRTIPLEPDTQFAVGSEGRSGRAPM